ncbi:MAG: ABC transporter ATP-binding protein [Candidatus Saganbacteria bacterium]|nr:ABC transporter ATP-binding protein [Candidatus Saganbacteria bacterium]
MPSLAIETRGLTKKFGNLTAVDNFSLQVNKGEIFGLLGPDGAGKTTTMRLLLDLIVPTSGTIKILPREKTGYVPQRFSLYNDLTVMENLDFYADLYGIPHVTKEQKKKELLQFTRLAPFVDRQGGKLSGGMKQKLLLMCALIHEPELLILDEPTTGVDPVSRQEFWKIISSLVPKVTVFISTAYMDEASRCDRVALMYKGKLMKIDTPLNIRNEVVGGRSMEEAFLDLIDRFDKQ